MEVHCHSSDIHFRRIKSTVCSLFNKILQSLANIKITVVYTSNKTLQDVLFWDSDPQ